MSAVIVSVRVDAGSLEAFDCFTQEIGLWWRANPLFPLTPRGDGTLRFAGAERLVTSLANGEDFEIGRVHVWLPGERLAFTWRPAGLAAGQTTHVEVRFEPVAGQTRVTIEHRGWDEVPQDHTLRHGFPLQVFQLRLAEHWRVRLSALQGMTARKG